MCSKRPILYVICHYEVISLDTLEFASLAPLVRKDLHNPSFVILTPPTAGEVSQSINVFEY
jgi:hypothetical protein